MNLYSRQIIGRSVSKQNNSSLICEALWGAILTQGGKLSPGIVHQSDRESSYVGTPHGRLLGAIKMEQSKSTKGNCYDNVAMEPFYGRYKSSPVKGHVFVEEEQARTNTLDYIEEFYNRF